MASPVAAMSGVPYALQPAGALTGNGNVLAIPNSIRYHQFQIVPVGTISTGAVTFETSNDPADANTWSPLATAVTVVSATDSITTITGVLNFVRARISTNVTGTGGSITVNYLGSKT